MQASRAWIPPTGTLGGFVQEAHRRAAELARQRESLADRASEAIASVGFALSLLKQRDNVAVIAEVKRRSPSKGWINQGLSAGAQAVEYERGGATAISVLTEPAHFGGSVEDLSQVLASVRLPVLKKDFHVDPVQLLEARAVGAAAALVIVRALPPDRLREMIRVGGEIGLEMLVEVRDEEELSLAVECGATIIGINNRNLETLAIDPTTCTRLMGLVPREIAAVAESGVSARKDVEALGSGGANAVLVGSAVSGAGNPASAVRALVGVSRNERAHAA